MSTKKSLGYRGERGSWCSDRVTPEKITIEELATVEVEVDCAWALVVRAMSSNPIIFEYGNIVS